MMQKDSRKRIPKSGILFQIIWNSLVPELATSWKGQEVSGIVSLWVETPRIFIIGVTPLRTKIALKTVMLGKTMSSPTKLVRPGKTTAGIKTMSW